jgi:hypothetical protein
MLVALLWPRRRKSAGAAPKAIGAGAASLGRRALRLAESAAAELRREGARDARQAGQFGESLAKHLGTFLHALLERAEDIGEVAADRAAKVTTIAAARASKATTTAARQLGKAGDAAEDAAIHAGQRIGRTVSEARSRIIG